MEKKWREFKGKRGGGKGKIDRVNEGVSKGVEKGRRGSGEKIKGKRKEDREKLDEMNERNA